MDITSVGFLSETLFQRYNGVVQDHCAFIEVRSPDNYDFWFGNYLLLPAPPEAGEIEDWCAKFDAVFDDAPEVRHRCLQWPDNDSDTVALREALERLGWKFEQTSVLCSSKSKSVRLPPVGVDFREVNSTEDWRNVLEQQVLSRPEGFAEPAYRAFKAKRLQEFQGLVNTGHGNWYGAFKGDELVADMGIFHRREISRFQEVSTHPKHRRQGICAALVHFVSCAEQAARPGNNMVILADRDEPAERIYKSVGYREIEQIQSVVLRPAGWDG